MAKKSAKFVKVTSPASKSGWLTVVCLADDDKPAEIRISGSIGDHYLDDSGTSSKEFTDALSEIPQGKKISLYINSPGGSVFQGLECYNALVDRSEDVTSYITGVAASIASVIPLAASRVVSPASSVWMIHCASCYTGGNAEEHQKSIEMLTACDRTIAGVYAAKTGKSVEDCLADMQKETWMTGTEANDYGLSDEMPDEDDDQPEDALAQIDLSKFKNVPAHIAKALAPLAKSSPRRITVPKLATVATASVSALNNTPQNTMNKKMLLAYLKDKGHPLPDDASDDAILAALNKIGATTATTAAATATAAPAADVAFVGQLAAIMAQLDGEKKNRIKREITDLALNRIPANQIDKWCERAYKDETVITDLAALPMTMPGHAPLNISASEPQDALETIKKMPKAKDRYKSMCARWDGLQGSANYMDRTSRTNPNATANSYSSVLVTQFLVDGAITQLQPLFAPLRLLTRDFSTDRYKPLATGQIKFVTGVSGAAGASVLVTGTGTNAVASQTNALGINVNPTNFETGASTAVVPCGVVVNHISRPFQVSDSDLNSGLRMADLMTANASLIANGVWQAVSSQMQYSGTAPIFNSRSPANYAVASSAFAFSDLQALFGNLKKSPIKNLILDGEYWAKLMNQPTYFQQVANGDYEDTGVLKAFGWDNIAMATDWTAAGSNARGFACNPQAVGVLSGLPLTPPNIPGATLQETQIKIPGVELTIALYSWFSLAQRTFYQSYDVMIGASPLDITAGQVITSS